MGAEGLISGWHGRGLLVWEEEGLMSGWQDTHHQNMLVVGFMVEDYWSYIYLLYIFA